MITFTRHCVYSPHDKPTPLSCVQFLTRESQGIFLFCTKHDCDGEVWCNNTTSLEVILSSISTNKLKSWDVYMSADSMEVNISWSNDEVGETGGSHGWVTPHSESAFFFRVMSNEPYFEFIVLMLYGNWITCIFPHPVGDPWKTKPASKLFLLNILFGIYVSFSMILFSKERTVRPIISPNAFHEYI